MDSTYIDIFVFTILFLSSLRGLTNGFISESKVAIALILGIYVSNRHSVVAKDILNEFFKIPNSMIDNASIFVSFFGVLISVYVISMFLQIYILRSGALSMYDRLIGLLFALAKVVIGLSILLYTTLVFVNLNDKTKTFLQNSISYKFLYATGFSILGKYINKEEDFMDSFVDNLINKDEAQKTIGSEIKKSIIKAKDDDSFIRNIKETFLK